MLCNIGLAGVESELFRNAGGLYTASSRAARRPRGVRRTCRPCGAPELADDRFVRQVVGVHLGLVVAIDRAAIDEQIAAAMAADVAQRDGLECLSFASHHGAGRLLTTAVSPVSRSRTVTSTLGLRTLRYSADVVAVSLLSRQETGLPSTAIS
jgi:hypothetical protein